jgi:PhnB protein
MARVNPIPKDMHTITPSLAFRGAAGAIDFYKKAFGAQEVMRMPSPDGKYIWHAELRIGDSVFYLNDEMPGSTTHAPSREHPATASLALYVEDADALFQRAVGAGAASVMPVQEMFWGDRMGVVTDPYGHSWMIMTHTRDLTEEEIRRGGEEFARRMQEQHSGASA